MQSNSCQVTASQEHQVQNTGALLVWVKTKLGKSVPEYAKKIAADGCGKGIERATKELSAVLNSINSNKRKQLITAYASETGTNQLAAWWEKHEATNNVIAAVE